MHAQPSLHQPPPASTHLTGGLTCTADRTADNFGRRTARTSLAGIRNALRRSVGHRWAPTARSLTGTHRLSFPTLLSFFLSLSPLCPHQPPPIRDHIPAMSIEVSPPSPRQRPTALRKMCPAKPPHALQTRNFINGEFAPSSTGKTFTLFNPATEVKVADLDIAGAADIDRAVAAAEAAQPAWADLSASARAACLYKLADLMEQPKHAAELKRVRLPLELESGSRLTECVDSSRRSPWASRLEPPFPRSTSRPADCVSTRTSRRPLSARARSSPRARSTSSSANRTASPLLYAFSHFSISVCGLTSLWIRSSRGTSP